MLLGVAIYALPIILVFRNDVVDGSEQTVNSQTTQSESDRTEQVKKVILVTGGAGFIGSHLVDRLMLDGHQVYVYDNFNTGRRSNIEQWIGNEKFHLVEHNVAEPINAMGKLDQIYHLASPASPAHYMADPIYTIKTIVLGTQNVLDLANKTGARLVIASTSEIYGDPTVHPQPESYWGNTNPIGPRSCYDESKRLGESLAVAYYKKENVSVGIARIFNTYGPRMRPSDRRVVSNFLIQALKNQPMTVYGSGEQTRSFQYITDLIDGLIKLMNSDVTVPVNLGNTQEITINSLANNIRELVPNSTSISVYDRLPIDDPQKRRPDVTRAKTLLDWSPKVTLEVGLQKTIEYFEKEINQSGS